jgi:hypothetical protein
MWLMSAVMVDVGVRGVVPPKSFLAPHLLLPRKFCCSPVFFSLLLLLSPSLCIFFPLLLLLLLLLLPKIFPSLSFRSFPLSSIVGFFAPSSSLDLGLDYSDRIVIVKIRSIDFVFCLLHAIFLFQQLGFLQGQAPLLQVLFDLSLLRLSSLMCLRPLFGSCDTSQVRNVLLKSPNRSSQLGYRRLESIPLNSPLGSTFFFLLTKCSDPSDFIVCFGT